MIVFYIDVRKPVFFKLQVMIFFNIYLNNIVDFCMSINNEVFFLNFFENSYDNKYYTVSFDNVLDLNNNLLNLPLPGSE